MDKISFIIADDHPTFREGLCRLLQDEGDLECVGLAGDGLEAVRLARELKPSVALVDINMPHLDGIQVTEQIKSTSPDTSVLILSAFDYESYVLPSLQAGASGYLLKNTSLFDLVSAIHLARNGDTVLDLKATDRVVHYVTCGERMEPDQLRPRELEVLKLAAKGMSNKVIAGELKIHERTVQTHLINAFRKLGVNSRTQAVLFALKAGWITLDADDKCDKLV